MQMREWYHNFYLKTWWSSFTWFYIFILIITTTWLIFLVPQTEGLENVKFIVPFFIVIILAIDVLIQRNNKVIHYVFLGYLFLFGFSISTESMWLAKFRIYEPFLLYYPTFILISIANCLEWKRMVLLFWIIMSYYMITTHIQYGARDFPFYFAMVCTNVLVPLIIMVIARIVLGFIQLIQKNQELVKTIKHILQVFPEGVIIQSYQETPSKELVVKFVNDTAQKEILTYDISVESPINEWKMDYTLHEIKKDVDSIDQELSENQVLISDLLSSHLQFLENNEEDAISEIQMKSLKNQEVRNFTVKSVIVNWESCK